ncbi:MAG: hypothetical protein JWN95_540 [Frankiales bacterium]|nr:hypothetical protein [Frankiales bacterium]
MEPVAPETEPAPSADARTAVLRWVRRALAVAALLGGWALIATDQVKVCEDQLSRGGAAVSVCHPPHIDDPIVIGDLLVVLLLLSPELTEFSVPGLIALKMRVKQQQAATESTAATVETLRQHVISLTNSNSSASNAVVTTNLVLHSAAQSGDETAALSANPDEAAPADEPAIDSRVISARLLLGEMSLPYLFTEAGRQLGPDVELHLYMPNDDGILLPVDEPGRDADDAGWPPGIGVVGLAWASRSLVVGRGAELRRAIDALPAPRQERYADIEVVAAVPVRNGADRPIAVLSAASRNPAARLDDGAARAQLSVTASLCARVLIDVLGWDDETPNGSYGQR